MRFLMITSFYPPHHFGGDATYVRQLSRALVRRGHSVRVVYCYDAYRASGGTIPKDAAAPDEGVEVRMLHAPAGIGSALISQQTGRPGPKGAALREELARPSDVVHFHNVSLMGAPAIFSGSRAPVTLLTAHDHWLVCASHIFWKNGREACTHRSCMTCQLRSGRPPQLWRNTGMLGRHLRGIDRILVPSAFTERKLREGGIDRPLTRAGLFAARDFDTLDPATPAESPHFVFAGRVTASKGIDRLARLFRERPDYSLDIVGNGDLVPALSEELADLRNVRIHRRVDQADLRRFYRRATATLLPSLAPETFGLTTVEGFSQGTPAIVRDAGGAGETVRAHEAGIVFDADREALEAMDRLAGEPALRAAMSARARAAYLAEFTEDVHVDAYLALVEEQRAARLVTHD